ncbi:MAG: hypothetical protein BWK80_03125 [Desulfobacteraceae bacterium IS3]|nr:MAG: hypothetical protein BWK80_03125 [Desulfobacteraceae bacterium IS3]
MSAFNEFKERVDSLGCKMSDVKNFMYLEDAAQRFTELLYHEFSKSVVLTRIFATIPFGRLPDFRKNFVIQLAESSGIMSQLTDNTPVLSLLGTYGQNEIWNNWRNSRGHIGIPLASYDFIDKIPMLSRLLKELGIRLEWLNIYDTKIVTKKIGRLAGLFYVQDAATALDDNGRKIISAQDFVRDFNIRTVFGMGGMYPSKNVYIVMINFTNRNLPHSGAELFMKLINIFNSETTVLLSGWKIFRP